LILLDPVEPFEKLLGLALESLTDEASVRLGYNQIDFSGTVGEIYESGKLRSLLRFSRMNSQIVRRTVGMTNTLDPALGKVRTERSDRKLT
jgi:hypothetical protein